MNIMNKFTVKNKEMLFRSTALVFLDILLIMISMAGSLWIRFDFSFTAIEPLFLKGVRQYMLINIITTLLIYGLFRLYTSLWRFAGVVELKNVICAVLLSTIFQFAGMPDENQSSEKLSVYLSDVSGGTYRSQQIFLSLYSNCDTQLSEL